MLDEKIYYSDKNIKYVFSKGNETVNKLIVIFSGYAAKDSTLKHRYNYVNILKDVNVHKLFILDDNGETGSYYFGNAMNFSVDSSVISLILFKARELHINLENIITLGSSKGGSAALYFGLKYKLGAVFAGAFQTKIADLIEMRRPESEIYLLGPKDNPDYKHRYEQLNSVMFNLLKSPIVSNLYLISSENDWQYQIHVKPFVDKLKELDISFDFNLSNEIQNHSEISIYFPIYFKSKLIEELFNIYIKNMNLELMKDTFKVYENSYNHSKNSFLLKYDYRINNTRTTFSPNTLVTPTIPGYYKFYYSVENTFGDVVYQQIIGEKYYGLGIVSEPTIKLDLVSERLFCEVITHSTVELSYAFYIKENGSIIDKIMYQKNNKIDFEIRTNATYTIQYFIQTDSGHKIINNSNPFHT